MLIVTDGAVDLPSELEHAPRLQVVPGHVWLGEEPYSESPDAFWALLRKGTYPSTSPPTVNALVEAYRHPDLVIAVHVSSELSTTLSRAEEAAARAGPGVIVVDTGSLSVGAGLVAAATHRAVEDPSGLGSISEYAQSLPGRLHTFALVQDVESLRRSNRSGLLPRGHLTRNHPVLLAVRGRVVPLEQTKNRAGAVKDLVAHLGHSVGPDLGAWALGHGDASDRDAIIEQLTHALGTPPAFVSSLDPTVGAHVGPEALVIAAISGAVDL